MGTLTIGVVKLDLHLPAARSLKDKRMLVKRLKERVHRRLGLALVELDHQDKWQRCSLAVVAIGTRDSAVEQALAQLLDGLEAEAPEVQILSCDQDYVYAL